MLRRMIYLRLTDIHRLLIISSPCPPLALYPVCQLMSHKSQVYKVITAAAADATCTIMNDQFAMYRLPIRRYQGRIFVSYFRQSGWISDSHPFMPCIPRKVQSTEDPLSKCCSIAIISLRT